MRLGSLINCVYLYDSQSSLTTHATHVADEFSLAICVLCVLIALIALIFSLFLLLCMFGKPRVPQDLSVKCLYLRSGSGRVFSGFGIWPKYGTGNGKMINVLTGSWIWLFPGKRDSPKIVQGCGIYVCVSVGNAGNPSRPTGSSGQSK